MSPRKKPRNHKNYKRLFQSLNRGLDGTAAYYPTRVTRHAAKRFLQRYKNIQNPTDEQIAKQQYRINGIFGKGGCVEIGNPVSENKRIVHRGEQHALVASNGAVITIYPTGVPIFKCYCPICKDLRKRDISDCKD